MSAEVSIDFSQLQQLVDEVQKTKQSQTVRLADGVVAVVKPDRKAVERKAKRSRTTVKGLDQKYQTIASLAGAAGTLPRPLSWQEMREIAWEDHILDKFGQEKYKG